MCPDGSRAPAAAAPVEWWPSVESRRLAEPLITLAIGVIGVVSIVYTLLVNEDETATRCPQSEDCDEY